jgi:Flp pilus assembly protein TadD
MRFEPIWGRAARLLATLTLVMQNGLAQQITPQSPLPTSVITAQLVVSQARARMRAGHFHDAEEAWRQALKADPQSRDAHAALAYCLLREDQPALALGEYTKAAALHAPNAEELVQVGQAYVLLGDESDADHWTLRAVRMSPGDPQAWYSLGRIRYTEQRFADAITCYRRALTLSPHNVKAENNLGLAEEGINQTAAAVVAYRQAIAWEQDTATPHAESGAEQPYLNLAIVLLHNGQLVEAQALLAHAVNLSSRDPRIYEQLGQLHLQQGDAQAAKEALSKATELDPANSALHFLLGQSYKRLGKKVQADAEFAEAARLARISASPKP